MKKPADVIAEHVAQRSKRTLAQLEKELEALEPLPDERAEWTTQVWERAYLFVAFSDLAAARRSRRMAKLLLERASYGDPGELMRGLRHSLEAIFDPDWVGLAKLCVAAAASDRPGTRLWAVSQLGVLREPIAADVLCERLTDEAELVRAEAALALEMLCAAKPKLTSRARKAVAAALTEFRKRCVALRHAHRTVTLTA